MLRGSNKTICLKIQIIARMDAVIDPTQGVARMLGKLLKMIGSRVREDCSTILVADAEQTSAKEELTFHDYKCNRNRTASDMDLYCFLSVLINAFPC